MPGHVFFAADRDDDADELDAAAGCEFVDDRIRVDGDVQDLDAPLAPAQSE